MLKGFDPIRYAIVEEKNKREIVMLRGRGCKWRKCTFCDYHLDNDPSDELNYELNCQQLDKVTGVYGKLEVINSGSFVDLDDQTMEKILQVALENGITEVHFECHWLYREQIAPLRKRFEQHRITVKVKTGVETFDSLFRESYLRKGIAVTEPKLIAEYFDECCLLLGLPGQTLRSMLKDIQIGLTHFERVCVNIMQDNGTRVKADPRVIATFKDYIYPIYIENERVDILMENTAFGVGGVTTHDENTIK